ncbi:MAG: helix-turn-helix transcriptional regulator [Clostridia bacterium]|nr:helix-turn-helix transcriptional regulator [Clostridia bacterium]
MESKNINIEIGFRVKEKRKAMKYTREALSELLDISPQFLAQIESGKRGMSFTTLAKVSAVLGVSCDYLILGKSDSPDRSRIYELASNIDEKYLPVAEDLLSSLLRAIALASE